MFLNTTRGGPFVHSDSFHIRYCFRSEMKNYMHSKFYKWSHVIALRRLNGFWHRLSCKQLYAMKGFHIKISFLTGKGWPISIQCKTSIPVWTLRKRLKQTVSFPAFSHYWKKSNKDVSLQSASTIDAGLLSTDANQPKTIDWISRCDRFTDEMTKVVSVWYCQKIAVLWKIWYFASALAQIFLHEKMHIFTLYNIYKIHSRSIECKE